MVGVNVVCIGLPVVSVAREGSSVWGIVGIQVANGVSVAVDGFPVLSIETEGSNVGGIVGIAPVVGVNVVCIGLPVVSVAREGSSVWGIVGIQVANGVSVWGVRVVGTIDSGIKGFIVDVGLVVAPDAFSVVSAVGEIVAVGVTVDVGLVVTLATNSVGSSVGKSGFADNVGLVVPIRLSVGESVAVGFAVDVGLVVPPNTTPVGLPVWESVTVGFSVKSGLDVTVSVERSDVVGSTVGVIRKLGGNVAEEGRAVGDKVGAGRPTEGEVVASVGSCESTVGNVVVARDVGIGDGARVGATSVF